jgi:hypothetical protein
VPVRGVGRRGVLIGTKGREGAIAAPIGFFVRGGLYSVTTNSFAFRVNSCMPITDTNEDIFNM